VLRLRAQVVPSRSRIDFCSDSTKSRVIRIFWKIGNPSIHQDATFAGVVEYVSPSFHDAMEGTCEDPSGSEARTGESTSPSRECNVVVIADNVVAGDLASDDTPQPQLTPEQQALLWPNRMSAYKHNGSSSRPSRSS
jgi:hypothetical protein